MHPRHELPEPRRLLNEIETAAMLGISRRLLQIWRERGEGLPFVRVSERRIAYDLADIEAFIAARKRTSAAEDLAAAAALA